MFQVGSLVRVWWPDDEAFYKGKVTQVRGALKNASSTRQLKIYVEYDDGQEEWLRVKHHTVQLLDHRGQIAEQINASSGGHDSCSEEGDENDDEELQRLAIGSRVEVWWPGEKEYFPGTVTRKHKKLSHCWFVEYDDDDEDWIDFRMRDFHFLDEAGSSSKKSAVGHEDKDSCEKKPLNAESTSVKKRKIQYKNNSIKALEGDCTYGSGDNESEKEEEETVEIENCTKEKTRKRKYVDANIKTTSNTQKSVRRSEVLEEDSELDSDDDDNPVRVTNLVLTDSESEEWEDNDEFEKDQEAGDDEEMEEEDKNGRRSRRRRSSMSSVKRFKDVVLSEDDTDSEGYPEEAHKGPIFQSRITNKYTPTNTSTTTTTTVSQKQSKNSAANASQKQNEGKSNTSSTQNICKSQECQLCHSTEMRNPVAISCYHIFCHRCIERQFHKSRKCPICLRSCENDCPTKLFFRPTDDMDIARNAFRPVQCFDMQSGDLIHEYPSASAASNDHKGLAVRIVGACNANIMKEGFFRGFFWRFEDRPHHQEKLPVAGRFCRYTDASSPLFIGTYAVEQLCLETGDILATFDSIYDAKRALGGLNVQTDKINSVCCGKRDQAYGYFWRKKGSIDMPQNVLGSTKAVQLRRAKNGQVVKEFNSVVEAAEVFSCDQFVVSRWCREMEKRRGYYWSYAALPNL